MSEVKKAEDFLRAKPGYLKTSDEKLAAMIGVSPKIAKNAKKHVKNELKKVNKEVTHKPGPDAVKKEFKRLFFDIETSYNTVACFAIGHQVSIGYQNILRERAVICICYKWAGDSKVHYLHWDKGNDKQMLEQFVKVLDSADEIIGHNSDKFDLKWLRARCLYHRIPMFPFYQTVDTLKLAREFYLNSKRLDYMGQFLGLGKKLDTGGLDLWKSIVEVNDPKAMDLMIKYCKQDVKLLEQVFNEINPYTKAKMHVGVLLGHDKCSCPNCGSERSFNRGFRYLASGGKRRVMRCMDCGKGYTLAGTIKV